MNDINFPQAILGMTHLALASALSDSLVALSAFKGREDLTWLDEMEAEFVENLKNSHTEGPSMEDEIKIIEGAIALLRFTLNEVRLTIQAADR